MTADRDTVLAPVGRHCRRVAAALIGALWPGKTSVGIEDAIAQLSLRTQVAVVGGVLGLLFLLSLFAAQFGFIGLAIFFGVVILVIR